ncbi:MAG: hypothetical protein ACTSRZ_10770 [Promethearchaeota archaeon]
MDKKDLERSLSIMKDISLSNEEIENINEKFMKVIKNFDSEIYKKFLNEVQAASSNKEDLNIKEIFELITANLDEETLENLIKAMTEDDELVEYLQELLIDKII